MRKRLSIIILGLAMTIGLSTTTTFAQTDSTSTPVDTSKSVFGADNFYTELTLASRNVYRGVSYGESPSIMMKGAWMPCNYFEIGVYGNYTMNGTKEGYGNQFNYYATIKPFANSQTELKNFSITTDDYFYFNSNDSMNNYMEFGSEKTQHFMESRVKYDGSKLDLTAAYTYYTKENWNVDGIYFEAGYDVSSSLNLFVGYLTDENALMFQTKEGFTNAGFTFSRKLTVKQWSPMLKISTIFSPTYKTIDTTSPGVGKNPVNFVASLTF